MILSFKKENPSMWIIYIIQNKTESTEEENSLPPLIKWQRFFRPGHSQAPSDTREMLDCLLVYSDIVVLK